MNMNKWRWMQFEWKRRNSEARRKRNDEVQGDGTVEMNESEWDGKRTKKMRITFLSVLAFALLECI